MKIRKILFLQILLFAGGPAVSEAMQRDFFAIQDSGMSQQEGFDSGRPEEEIFDSAWEDSPYLLDSEKKGPIEAFWKSVFRTQVFSDRATINSIVSMEIYGRLKWDLLDSLSFQTHALVIGRNGFTQSIYERDDRGRGLHILEGLFQWSPFSSLSIKFGNIRQSFLKAPLLVTDKTFPSVVMQVSPGASFDRNGLSFLFQSAIPDNAEETVMRERQLVRGVPLFSTASLVFNSSDFLFGSRVQDIFTFFHYYNISSAVANRSRIYGNKVLRTGGDSAFKFGFTGFYNHFSWKRQFSDFWFFELGGGYLYNLRAPDTYNEGMRVYSSLYHNYRDLVEIKFMGELFSNQSDSSIAYYNSEKYGHNNRKGFLAKLENHLYDSGLTLGASFAYSWPINDPDLSTVGPSFSVSVFLMTNYIAI